MNRWDLNHTQQFFYANSAWLVMPGEDSETARINNAIELAEAEECLKASGAVVTWTQNGSLWDAVIVHGDVTRAMPGILLHGPDDDYKRVIEAKLMQEVKLCLCGLSQ